MSNRLIRLHAFLHLPLARLTPRAADDCHRGSAAVSQTPSSPRLSSSITAEENVQSQTRVMSRQVTRPLCPITCCTTSHAACGILGVWHCLEFWKLGLGASGASLASHVGKMGD